MERLVEPVGPPELGHLLRRGVRRQHEERRVAGEVDQQEHEQRAADEHRQRIEQPPGDDDGHVGAWPYRNAAW